MVQGRVLVVAGSDCSGGAGLEADQKVLAAHGCYAMTATTALTVQTTRGVSGIHAVPGNFVGRQMEACVGDIGVDVVKTGMLTSAETIRVVADVIARNAIPNLVVDPVMVSTSGAQLLPSEAVADLIRHLLPTTTVLTPNIPEAILILSQATSSQLKSEDINTIDDLADLGRRIQALGPKWVLMKGGHLPFTKDLTRAVEDEQREVVVDVLVGPKGVTTMESPWLRSSSTHGTGCSLASAISAGIAKGRAVPEAVRAACRYVEAGIVTAPKLGGGHGPLNHFHSNYMLPFSPGYFVEYLLSRPDVKPVWDRFVHHPFVMALGDGTLPLDSFKGYIIQDYLYLIQFARANALAAYKASSFADIDMSNQIVGHIMREVQLHITYCGQFGISEEEMKATEEHQACTAYTRYVLDVGQSSDWFALQIALAPCLLGYGAVARMLHGHEKTVKEGNTYWPWIMNYVADDYVQAVRTGSKLLEDHARLQSPSRIDELVKIFIHATKMEIGFWDMFPHKPQAQA